MMETRDSRVLRTIPILIAICLVGFPAHAQYGGGSGTTEDPYQIWTAEHLNAIGAEPNDWDKHFKLMADIDLSGYAGTEFNIIAPSYSAWPLPSLDSEEFFTGIFDGCGHTIQNLTYVGDGSFYGGLFGKIEGEAQILNLILENVSIECDYTAGGLAGSSSKETRVSNCHVKGCVHVGCLVGPLLRPPAAGGLVGANSGQIDRSSFAAVVSGDGHKGGLVGRNYGTIACSYSTSVQAPGSYVSLCDQAAGGLVGSNTGVVSDCYSEGWVQQNHTIGGLVGENIGGEISNCYSNCAVSKDKPSSPWFQNIADVVNVGGLVGYNTDMGIVRNSLWDIETSGQQESAGGSDRTSAEMMDPETYLAIGWDFVGEEDNGIDDIWYSFDMKDYPRLTWENLQGDIAFPVGIDIRDLDYLASHWLHDADTATWCYGTSDLDESGIVNFYDFSIMSKNWMPSLPLDTVISRKKLYETVGPNHTTVTMSRRGDTTGDLYVFVRCLNPSQISAPAIVLIPSGVRSRDFDVKAVNDGEPDGTKSEELLLWARGFRGQVITLTVVDESDTPLLGGAISGAIGKNTYDVVSNLHVNADQTLTVEAGTVLRFLPGLSFVVNGTLQSEGRPDDMIVFTSLAHSPQPGDWGGIMCGGSNSTLSLSHTEIAFARTGISMTAYQGDGKKLIIGDSDIGNSSIDGISVMAYKTRLLGDDVSITASRIHDCDGSGIDIGAHADGCRGASNYAHISGNLIYRNEGAGISLAATNGSYWCVRPGPARCSVDPTIVSNTIYANGIGIGGWATPPAPLGGDNIRSLSPTIFNNLIYQNGGAAIVLDCSGSPKILNNTIAENLGAGIGHRSSFADIVNNVIARNKWGIMAIGTTQTFACGHCEIAHNNVHHNSNGNWVRLPQTYGMMRMVNANGTPADKYMNISVDPLFVGSGDYHLQPGSLCINAGIFIDGLVPAEDFDGDARVEPIDIGFDEVVE